MFVAKARRQASKDSRNSPATPRVSAWVPSGRASLITHQMLSLESKDDTTVKSRGHRPFVKPHPYVRGCFRNPIGATNALSKLGFNTGVPPRAWNAFCAFRKFYLLTFDIEFVTQTLLILSSCWWQAPPGTVFLRTDTFGHFNPQFWNCVLTALDTFILQFIISLVLVSNSLWNQIKCRRVTSDTRSSCRHRSVSSMPAETHVLSLLPCPQDSPPRQRDGEHPALGTQV